MRQVETTRHATQPHRPVPTGPSPRSRREDERGQALVLVLAVVALVVVTGVAIQQVVGTVVDRQRAQTAADALALYAVGAGCDAIGPLADRHSARVVSCVSGEGEAEVEAEVGRQRATARASRRP